MTVRKGGVYWLVGVWVLGGWGAYHPSFSACVVFVPLSVRTAVMGRAGNGEENGVGLLLPANGMTKNSAFVNRKLQT